MSSPRLIAGNLDCELEYAGSARGLPGAVAERVSALATLLRVFAADGDRLWTPRPIDPAQVVPIPELPRVVFESGKLAAAAPAPEVLAWGETPSTAALRERADARPAHAFAPGRGIWDLPAPTPEAAARCNHRGFAFAVARELGCALPGARMIRARTELEGHLAAGGARAGGGAWVVKAPFGAAGRERLVRRSASLARDARVRIDRLLARCGELLFEPWVERTADFGICGELSREATRLDPPHRLRCDRQGVIRAVEIDDHAAAPPALRDELVAAATAAAGALRDADYLGPFNIDAFSYLDEARIPRVQPLCEINARLSLGAVARALGRRIAAPRGLSPGRLDLRLDRQLEAPTPTGPGAIDLLRPGGRGGAAVLIIDPARRARR